MTGYCVRCRAMRTMVLSEAQGRNWLKGSCEDCGTPIFKRVANLSSTRDS